MAKPRADLQRLRPRAPTRYESSHRFMATGKRAAAPPLPGPASAPRAQRKALVHLLGTKHHGTPHQTACLPRGTRTAGLPLEVLHLRRARATRCIRLPALTAPDCTDAPGGPREREGKGTVFWGIRRRCRINGRLRAKGSSSNLCSSPSETRGGAEAVGNRVVPLALRCLRNAVVVAAAGATSRFVLRQWSGAQIGRLST